MKYLEGITYVSLSKNIKKFWKHIHFLRVKKC